MNLQFPSILLSVVVFASLLAFIAVLFMPERSDEERSRVRIMGLAGSGAALVVLLIFGIIGQIGQGAGGGTSTAGEENYPWLRFAFVANYHLTADGISLVLLLLSTVLFLCAFFHAFRVREQVKLYVALLLLLETAVNGVLCAGDYLLFVIFWGMAILPLYLLVRAFGGPERRRAAATYLGFALLSLVLLVASVTLVVAQAKQHSSDISTDYTALLGPVQTAAFWLSFAGFAIGLAAFPLHRWMVAVVSEASPGVAAILSGAVLPLGAYGMMRISLPAFPQAAHTFSLAIVGLAVVGAVWGGLVALAQDDLRRFLAYVNLAQLSLVLLAVGAQTSVALVGAVFAMVMHGAVMTLLLLLSGALEERTRTRSIRLLGGLAAQLPRLAGFWSFGVLTAVGAPLLVGFVAIFMVSAGSFPAHRVATTLVLGAQLLSAGGLLWVAHRVFFGPTQDAFSRARDATALELSYLVPLVTLVLVLGIRPGAFTPMLGNGVLDITTRLSGG